MKETCTHVLLFLPDTLDRQNVGLLEGFSAKYNDTLAIFIINEELLSKSSGSIIGFCSQLTPEREFGKHLPNAEWVHINIDTGEIRINNSTTHREKDCIVTCIEYNYNLFAKTETVDVFPECYGVHFEALINSIKRKNEERSKKRSSKLFSLFSCLLVNFIYVYFQIVLKVTFIFLKFPRF